MTRVPTLNELLAEARAHGLALTPTTELGGFGLDFAVAQAAEADGTVWMLRTPRRDDVYATTLVEARVLALVRPHLSAAVPEWRVHTSSLIAYPRLSGTPAVVIEDGAPRWQVIDPAAPCEPFLRSYAQLLAGLQRVPLEAAAAAAVPVKAIADVRDEHARAMDLNRATLEVPERLWARWQRWLEDDALWPPFLALVHADLHAAHLLLDDAGHVTGALDWTEAHVGDPGTDFAMAFGTFGRAATERLVAEFEATGGRTWPRLIDHAAERWAAFPALGAEWARRTGNDFVMDMVRQRVATTAAEMAA